MIMTRSTKNLRAEELRRMLAQEAARIMADQGINDFFLAKRKAAERLAVTDKSVLPKNTEIEAALAEHHRLFGAQRHETQVRELREIALEAMRLFQDFQPRLVGPVLTGTANEHSEILLHLFTDQLESVGWRLDDRAIPFRLVERRVRFEASRQATYPVYSFVAGTQQVDAIVFPVDGIRQAPLSPVDGKPLRRGAIAEVEELVAME
jgi:hypothetical protein